MFFVGKVVFIKSITKMNAVLHFCLDYDAKLSDFYIICPDKSCMYRISIVFTGASVVNSV